mgnify:CR=1 FL=1
MTVKNNAWECISAKGQHINASRNIYVLKAHYPEWQTLKGDYQGNYYYTTILRALYSLNALAGVRSSSTQSLKLDGAQINYALDDAGDVRVYGLNIDKDIKPFSAQQETGVYEVLYERNAWVTQEDSKLSMELNHQWGSAHYAAVSGKFDSKEDAGRKLIRHVNKAYKAAIIKKDSHKNNNHYSLYWQNGKHNSVKQRNHLASLIQQAQAKDARLNWLVHGEGASTFVNALNQLIQQPLARTIMAKGGDLSGQSVFFSNPRGQGTSEKELVALCDKAGLNYVGLNKSSADLYNPDTLAAFKTEALKVGSALKVSGALGVIGAAAVPIAYEQFMNSNSVMGKVAIGVAAFVIVQSSATTVHGYGRNLKSVWTDTVGRGNEDWA